MSRVRSVLFFVPLLLALGCTSVVGPRTPVVSGIVRYPDGQPVVRAKVWIPDGATTFSDSRGAYVLPVAAGARTVTLYARDGYTPGIVYAVTHFTAQEIEVARGRTHRDLVLADSSPI